MARRHPRRSPRRRRGAGWLYYIAGKTQDEVAAAMGISRQAAQRLVSLAVPERLVRVWMEHPIARCLDLAAALTKRFGLAAPRSCPPTPTPTAAPSASARPAPPRSPAGSAASAPLVMAVGTGRSLKAAIDHLPPIDCPQHRIVSLTGNIGPDGSAAYYNVIFSMAEAVQARHFPMPLPVFVASPEERALMHGQGLIRSTLALAANADVAFVGIGEMDAQAPLYLDRFLTGGTRRRAGRRCGRRDLRSIFDRDGRLRRSAAPTPAPPARRSPTAAARR